MEKERKAFEGEAIRATIKKIDKNISRIECAIADKIMAPTMWIFEHVLVDNGKKGSHAVSKGK